MGCTLGMLSQTSLKHAVLRFLPGYLVLLMAIAACVMAYHPGPQDSQEQARITKALNLTAPDEPRGARVSKRLAESNITMQSLAKMPAGLDKKWLVSAGLAGDDLSEILKASNRTREALPHQVCAPMRPQPALATRRTPMHNPLSRLAAPPTHARHSPTHTRRPL